MSVCKQVWDRRFILPWLVVLVFTLSWCPTALWAQDAQDATSVLGTWKITVTIDDNTQLAFITYSPGGGMVMVDNGKREPGQVITSGYGSWTHQGGNKFAFAFEQFVLQDGMYAFTWRVDETIRVTGDAYQGEFQLRKIAPDGSLSDVIVSGTTSAVRLKVQE